MLNGQQRAYLRSIANTIDTILIIGKGGITQQVIKQADDALTAREIIKGKVLENSDLTSRQAADMLSEEVSSDVVQAIGSKFTLYRQSSDEKKRRIELPR